MISKNLNLVTPIRLKSKIQLVVLDIDNTLVNSTWGTCFETLHQTDIETIKACLNRGINIVLASARPPRSMRKYWSELNLPTLAIAYNGGVIWDFKKGEAKTGWYLSNQEARNILKRAKLVKNLFTWVESQDTLHTETSSGEALAISVKRGGKQPTIHGNLIKEMKGPINKIVFHGENYLHLTDALSKEGYSITVYDHPRMAEVRSNNVNKGQALTWLCRYLSIPTDRVASIGDGVDDISLFANSGLGIAMENAPYPVRIAANKVTKDVSKQGVSYALERFILNNFSSI